jgi:hypothetical protein
MPADSKSRAKWGVGVEPHGFFGMFPQVYLPVGMNYFLRGATLDRTSGTI